MANTPDPVVILLTLGLLSLAPFMAIMVTSFAKIVIVLALVRNALGLQQVPPNLVVNGLALVLSMYIMAPLGVQISQAAEQRLAGGGQLQAKMLLQILGDSREPLRQFLGKHAQPREREFFVKSATRLWPAEQARDLREDDLMVLVPAFTVSELTAAFKIGFIIYLAFEIGRAHV